MNVIELDSRRLESTVEYTESELYELYITILKTTPEKSEYLFSLYYEWNGYDIFEKYRAERKQAVDDAYKALAKGYMNMDINRLTGFY